MTVSRRGGIGIERMFTSVRRPSAIGKIEAFHKAHTCEASIYTPHKESVKY